MRKVTILSIIISFFAFGSFAQEVEGLKLGIKIAPTFGSSRVLLDDPDITVDNDGSNFKLSIGLVADKEFGSSYIFSTGLIYMPKTIGITASDATSTNTFNSAESYKLQYLQIPATIKLFTNEVQPDVKVYFQLGMALELKVYEEADPDLAQPELITQFNPINVPVIIGTGIEYRAGLNTIVFAGLSYQRGLTNIVGTTNSDYTLADELSIRNTVLSIDAGIKF